MVSWPRGLSVPAIHCLRAASGEPALTNQVQGLPASMAASGRRRLPLAMTVAHPADSAMRAATSLVTMPPEPNSVAEAPASASMSGVISCTSGIRRAPGSRVGSAS